MNKNYQYQEKPGLSKMPDESFINPPYLFYIHGMSFLTLKRIS